MVDKQLPLKSKDTVLYDELTRIMANEPEKIHDFHDLMNAATQGISYGISLKRTIVAFISKDGSRLKAHYSVGCNNFPDLKNFETKIIKGTIFQKLCDRAASICIKESSDKKIKDLIPADFKSTINVDEYILMSVFVGKDPVAILYADNLDGEEITPKDYSEFKFLCGALSTALQYFAKKANTPEKNPS